MPLFKKKRSTKYYDVNPDEIFLDSRNLPQFNTQQFEGRIEKPISKKTIAILGVSFTLVGLIFLGQLSVLQISRGQAFFQKSENNSLNKTPLFASRGLIYDRNNVELAWNEENTEGNTFLVRSYINAPGFSHLLGYVSSPSKDKQGNYWQAEFIGKDGIEKTYNEDLQGENGTQILETNARGEVQSTNIVDPPKDGDNITLSVDSRVQAELYKNIKLLADQGQFKGGAGVIMNIENGEILALTNYPEYSSNILSKGEDRTTINSYFTDTRKVFLNRAVMGNYTPGSIVKPFFALGALNEGIITPQKVIYTTGSISIPNPYDPKLKTVFKDWQNQGPVDMRKALAMSSDVYFYEIGGGFQDQKGLGIANIEKYARMFGIGSKTGIDLSGEQNGVIPSPEWKAKNFKGDAWRVGDTYHTAIGQYGFQASPLEMVRAVGALASDGTLVVPHVILNKSETSPKETISIPEEYFEVVKNGMRDAVTYGTAVSLSNPYVKVAAKTGTAQVGLSKQFVNSWVVGYFPADNPKYAFTVLTENGPANNSTKAAYVMKNVFEWMSTTTPDYLK